MAEHEAVGAPRANIGLAGNEGNPIRLRRPPPLEQLGLSPGLEYDARRRVEAPRDDDLTLGLPFHRCAVLPEGGITLHFCVHRRFPSVSILRRSRPMRRSV